MKLQDGWYVFPQPHGDGSFEWEPFKIQNGETYSGYGDKRSFEEAVKFINDMMENYPPVPNYLPVRPL